MADDEAPAYSWTPLDDADAASSKFVKAAGRAKVVYPNGDTYTGGFNEAKQKHGRGVYVWSSAPGSHPWIPEEGYPEGKEVVVKYEGTYLDGKRHGIGKLWLPNGETYHGEWLADKYHGVGTYTYKSGDIFSGHWARGVKQGEGVFISAVTNDDVQLVGVWEAGALVSGKWIMKDGTTWQGPFKDGKPLGRGMFVFPSGLGVAGEYVQVGDPDDDSVEPVLTWKGGAVKAAGVAATEVGRAPVVTL